MRSKTNLRHWDINEGSDKSQLIRITDITKSHMLLQNKTYL